MIICIGPFCVPLWHLGVLLLMFLRPLFLFFRSFFIRKEEEAEEDAAIEKNTTETQAAAANDANIRKRQTASKQQGVIPAKTAEEIQKLKEEAEAAALPLIIDFNATWCAPCRRIKPLFQRLAEEYKGVFVSVDVDEAADAADLPGALPTFRVYRGAKIVEDLTGAYPSKLEDLVRRHCAQN